MKAMIACRTCGHVVEMEEDERVRFAVAPLHHRPDGGHEYTVVVSVSVGHKGFDA